MKSKLDLTVDQQLKMGGTCRNNRRNVGDKDNKQTTTINP